jgi:hypothetical protein
MDGKTGSDNPTPREKRTKNRRLKADRREEIRFEPSKENRRKNHGRRSSDIDIWKSIS